MRGPRIFLPALQALTQVLYNYISLPTTQDLTQELSAMYAHNRTWHHQTHPYGSDVWGRQCILAFTDWEQTVCVNGIYSSSSTLMHGALQGSAWIISLHSLWYFYVSHYPSSFFVMKACRFTQLHQSACITEWGQLISSTNIGSIDLKTWILHNKPSCSSVTEIIFAPPKKAIFLTLTLCKSGITFQFLWLFTAVVSFSTKLCLSNTMSWSFMGWHILSSTAVPFIIIFLLMQLVPFSKLVSCQDLIIVKVFLLQFLHIFFAHFTDSICFSPCVSQNISLSCWPSTLLSCQLHSASDHTFKISSFEAKSNGQKSFFFIEPELSGKISLIPLSDC